MDEPFTPFIKKCANFPKIGLIPSLQFLIPLALPFALSIAAAEVTDKGSYQVSVPIEVPEFHKLTPNIQLTYDSNADNGLLGLGWSLLAGSHLTRTANPTGVPHYDASDELWLDGMQLVPCKPAPPPTGVGPRSLPNSASCKTGGSHTTRVDNFNRIRHDVKSNNWTVWSRDGTRFIYGPRFGDVSSPHLTHQWVLTDVIDTYGNRVSYNYACETGLVCYPSEIIYGEGKLCEAKDDRPVDTPIPGVRIRFYWQIRPDPKSTAVGNALAEIRLRLRAIDIEEGGKRVRVYQINYREELTGTLGHHKDYRSWITSIQMFGSDAELDASQGGKVISGTGGPLHTFEAPSFSYAQAPAFPYTLAGNRQFLPVGPAHVELPSVYDARLMQIFPPSSMVIRTNRPHAPHAVQLTNLLSTSLGDFDGDGKIDFMQWSMNGACSELKTRTMMARKSSVVDQTFPVPEANFCQTMTFSADLDGDGRTDILFIRYRLVDPYDPSNSNYEAETISALSNGDGKFWLSPVTKLWTTTDRDILLQSRCGVGDVNGDGRSDLLCTVKQGSRWIISQAVSDGYGGFQIGHDGQANNLTDLHMLALADSNGDGRSDLIVVDQRPGTDGSMKLHLSIAVSKGGGAVPFQWSNFPTDLKGSDANQKSHILIGDFNGDARADASFVIINDDESGGSFTTFSSQGGGSQVYRVNRQTVAGRTFMATVGDPDGDGLDDLILSIRIAPHDASICGRAIGYAHQSLMHAKSNGDGTFKLPERNDAPCYSGPYLGWPSEFEVEFPVSVDLNGDRVTDELYVSRVLDEPESGRFTENFSLVDHINPYAGSDDRRWRSTDVNGDGLADWMYVNYGNPGLIVLTLLTQPDGTRRRVQFDVASDSTAVPTDLARPEAVSNWFLVDVGGGPARSPDGKADIVLVDDVSRQIITLLSNGDGTWTKVLTPYSFSLFTHLRGVFSFPDTGDISNWSAIDTNGDGLTDLVHIAFRQTAAGQPGTLHVKTLRALGDGKWDSPISGNYTFGGNFIGSNVRGYLPVDLNGDGRVDLVKVDRNVSGLSLGHNTVVWSLIARSDGMWDDRYDTLSVPYSAPSLWRPMEINGDGRTDIAYFISESGQPFHIYTILSLGNGRWQDGQAVAVSPGPIVNTESSADLSVIDLDHDGRQDILHLSKVGLDSSAIMVIWNRFPYFVQDTTTSIDLKDMNRRSWHLVDVDGDDHPEFVRIRPNIDTDLDLIAIPVWETRMTQVKNGVGGTEEISYATSIREHLSMPLGVLVHVVKWTGMRTMDFAGRFDSMTNYVYAGATYSHRQRRFLGFTHVEKKDNARILAIDLELTPDCGGRRSVEEVLDPQSQLIRRTRFTFTAHPDGAPFPFLCRVERILHEEWEKASVPRVTEAQLSYDDYGNLARVFQSGDQSDTRDDRAVESISLPNVQDYIVDRPAVRKLFGFNDQGIWAELSKTLYEYDNSRDHSLPPGHVGELTRQRRWNDRTNRYADSSFQFDQKGNLLVFTGPSIPSNNAGVAVRFEYDCEFQRFPEKKCDGIFCNTIGWNKRMGLLSHVFDENGYAIRFYYDALGRQELTQNDDGSFDRWHFPSPAQLGTPSQAVIHERFDGSPSDNVLWKKIFFDGLGRTKRIEREGGIAEEVTQYDGTSTRVRAYRLPAFKADPVATLFYDYDALGRLTRVTHPDGSNHQIEYKVGQRIVTDELHAKTHYTIDPFDRITSVQENQRKCIDENCPITSFGITYYSYDARDLLIQILDAKKNRTELLWDSLGKPRRICDPDLGCSSYGWNDDGSPKSETYADGATIRITYDSMGRLIGRTSFDKGSRTPVRTITWIWDYDKTLHKVRGASLNRVTHIEDVSKDISAPATLLFSYRYDRVGRVDLSKSCVDARCVELLKDYDLAGRLQYVTYPDQAGRISSKSERVKYIYDESGELISIPGYVRTFRHDAAGRTTFIQFENGFEESRPHDHQRGWIEGVNIVNKFGKTLFSQRLLHDKGGRVSQETIAYHGTSRIDTYTHDDLSRLVDVASSDASRNQHFDYDFIGNLTYHSRLGRIGYTDPAHVHAITGTGAGGSYQYDALGQMISSHTLKVWWNHENRPTMIENITSGRRSKFAYDMSGRRVKNETTSAVRTQPDPLVEVDSHGNVTTWVVAEGRRLGGRSHKKDTYFIHADSMGSTRFVTDSSGTILDINDYSVWGEQKQVAGGGKVTHGFIGSPFDVESSLNYMNARYYNPTLGHFISPDTIIPDVYDPQSLNRYTYAMNDPATLSDPSGHTPNCKTTPNPGGNGWTEICVEALDSPTSPRWTDEQWDRASASEKAKERKLAQHVIIACKLCHAPNPNSPNARPVTPEDVSRGAMAGGLMMAFFVAPAVPALAVGTEALYLEGTLSLYMVAPRFWNFVTAAGASAFGISQMPSRGVPLEKAVAAGLVPRGGNLFKVLEGIQRGYSSSNPTNALAALSIVKTATNAVNLEPGFASFAATGGIVLQNKGGIVTTLGTDGSILVQRGMEVLLHLIP